MLSGGRPLAGERSDAVEASLSAPPPWAVYLRLKLLPSDLCRR